MTLASIDSLCPACEGSSRLATSHRLDGHHQVVQCSHCRLDFLVPFIRGGMSSGSSSSAVTSPSYIEMMTRDYERLKDRIHQRAMSRLDLYSRLLGGRKPHRILDIGCGPGWLVKAYNEAGVQASGMEILPELIVVARSLGTDVNQGDICEIPDDAEPIYDVITCSQALEHILTPRLAVRNMARLLRPAQSSTWTSRTRTPGAHASVAFFSSGRGGRDRHPASPGRLPWAIAEDPPPGLRPRRSRHPGEVYG